MKKTILSILLAICLLTSIGASALEEVSCTYDQTGKTHITGTAEPGESVTVRIFKKKNHLDENGDFSYTKAKSDLSDSVEEDNIQSVLYFADESLTDDTGKFTFNARIAKQLGSDGQLSTDVVSDIYVVITKTMDDEEITEYLFVDPEERALDYRALSLMKESNKAEVVAFLEGHKYALGIYASVLDKMDTDKAYDLMYDYLVSEKFDVADMSDDTANDTKNIAAISDMQKVIVIEALNQGKADTIANYESELMISNSEVASWYTKSIVNDAFKLALTKRLSQKSIIDISAFDEVFKEAIILEFVASSDGLDDTKNIIEEFKEDIGYNTGSVINENAVRNAMGTKFNNYSSLKSALDGYNSGSSNTDTDNAGGNGSSASSGGSSSSGKKYNSTTLPGIGVTVPKPVNSYFSDLADASWAIEAINYLSEKNVLAGRGDGIFAPNDNVTRAEFAKILVTAFGLTQNADIAFTDVSADSWYYDAVSVAVGSGIAKGMSDGRFGPEENITRQDMAVMLMNAAKLAKAMTETDGNVSFADEAEISDYAKAAVNTLTKAGIINGTGDGKFAPKAYATRAQAAKLVHALMTYK